MLKHILIPLDGSALAEEALLEARHIIEPGAMITLLTIVDLPPAIVPGMYPTAIPLYRFETFKQEAVEASRAYLQRKAEELEHDGFEVETIVDCREDPAEAIIHVAREHDAQAIVMSTHGRSGLSRWLFGSVTNKVVSAAPCPVLIVPNRARQRDVQESTSEMHIG
jgi:nucleotide-binding universal stress UspA family protein